MHTEYVDYSDGDTRFEGYLALEDPAAPPLPCIILAHAWDGLNAEMRDRTERLAQRGRIGFALDVYGAGVRGGLLDDNTHLMAPLLADRALLRRRLAAAVTAARAHPRIDPDRIVVLGYCFGGLCALDVARAALPGVLGVASVHGLLTPPGLPPRPIPARILIEHGWSDPYAPPADLLALTRELTDAGADWQLHAHGHALHAFTLEGADLPERGIRHHPAAARRCALALDSFLTETFAP